MKNTSKILALVLVVMTILMSLTAITASAADSTRVYCNNEAGWSNVYCYFWNNSGNGGAWPGKAMTYDETLGLYYYDIPAGYVNVIFNGGSGKPQSADLTVPTDDKVVYNNAVKGWGVLGGVAEEPEVTTVYVKNTANWSTVYCYACTDGWAAETAWPGNAMTYDESLGLWKYDVLDGYVRLIFNGGNGKPQSADLTTPTTDAVVFDNGAGTWGTIDGETVVVAPKFIIAGSDSTDAASIFGTAWDTANEANLMTLDEETGVYTIVYDNVPAGSYKFKATRDNSWTSPIGDPNSGDKDGNYLLTVAGLSKVTISCKDGDTKLTVTVESLHTHSWSDATCAEPQKCECGETQGEALGHTWADATCTAPKTCSVCSATEGEALGHTWADATCTAPKTCSVCSATEGEALGHTFVEGKCACGAEDPDYVAPLPEGTYVFESSKLDEAAAGDFADGTVVKVDDYFSLILGAKSKIDSSSKTWKEEDWGELAYKSGQRLYLGGKTSTTANAIVFTTSKAATVTVWWVSNGEPNEDGTGSRPIGILDSEGNILVQDTTGVAKNALHISTFEIPAAGTYYLGNMVDNNYFFKVQVVEKDVEAPHVNTLVVGDTNKIIIDAEHGALDNGYGYPTIAVFFTAAEAGHYKFAADGVTILIFSADGKALLGAGEADLEAGMYCIFLAFTEMGKTGECNVAVTQSEIVVPDEPVHENKLVVGENNKIVVDGSDFNQNNNPIEWVPFVADEKAVYTFTSETENALVYIFNADYSLPGGALVSSAILEPGNYIICVGNGAVGDIYVQVTKTEIPTECEHNWVYMNCTLCGAANPNFAHNLLVAGENKVVCNEYHLVDTTGHGNPYQFTLLTVAEDGLYVFTCDKLIGITIFTTEITDPDADFTAGTGASWKVYTTNKAELKAGTYYIGFIYVDGVGEYTVNIEKHDEHNHEAVVTAPTCTEAGYTTHTCVCGDTYTDSEVAALGHDYVEGVCSRCESEDPDYVVPEEPGTDEPGTDEPEELSFFQKIIRLIKDLLAKFLGFFKRFGI